MSQNSSRRSFLAGAGTAATVGLAGCTGIFSSNGTLSLLDFGYVYPDGIFDTIEDKIGTSVELKTSGSSANSLSLLRSGRADSDIVALGNYAVSPAIEEELIQPLNIDDISRYDGVFDFVQQDYFTADGQIYAAPRSFGQTPLAVNTDEVSAEEVTSLSVLFDQDYEGLVGHRDDARLQFLYERAANGKTPLNPSSADQVDFADTRDNLERHVELAGDLWGNGGSSEQLLRSGQVAVEPVWNYVIYSMNQSQDDFSVERVYPEEGTKAWYLQFCVREGADNVDAAHEFINAWYDGIGYQSLVEPSHIAVPHESVFERDGVDRAEYGLNQPERFIYEDPKPQSLVEDYTETWNEAKQAADA
ncbi:MAG: spermidine/putrescine-binding periplasmic protein [halophilic archaeon J07HX5]|jgi:Spermidine/putrescine-binding periplasmic protein|nr:MAG: spermidine/putrescine-binding periplasmic protein [halophilic archaeon J07HX5]